MGSFGNNLLATLVMPGAAKQRRVTKLVTQLILDIFFLVYARRLCQVRDSGDEDESDPLLHADRIYE